MEVDKESDQISDIYPHWMAAHARLKNEFTENEKCHNLMSRLICAFYFALLVSSRHCIVLLGEKHFVVNVWMKFL